MQFSKIVGDIDPKLIAEAEDKLTGIFLELGSGTDNISMGGTQLGGDPLIFALVVPAIHILTTEIPTAATNGKQFFWGVQYLLQASPLRLRLTVIHESIHSLFLHPQRVGNRHLPLWWIAVDYVCNGMLLDDLRIRFSRNPKTSKNAQERAEKTFIAGLGNMCSLEQCIFYLQHPDEAIPGMEKWQADQGSGGMNFKFFYADLNLSEEMKRPERIYDLLFPLLQKCPDCHRLGIKPPNSKLGQPSNDKGKGAGNQAGSEEGNGSEQGKGNKGAAGCSTCGGRSLFDFGGNLVDEHMESVEDIDELSKRINDAIETAKAMAGNVPAGLTEELMELSKPRISFQDVIRSKLHQARKGNERADWSRFRNRPLAFGLLIPRRKGSVARAICLLDTSASVSKEQLALGVSQLQALDERAEIVIVPADAQIYWNEATKVRRCNAEELCKVKIVGKGGTKFAEFFEQYENRIHPADFLIVLTDGLLDPKDMAKMKDPKCPVYWLISGDNRKFNSKFGKVFFLNE